MWAKITIRYVTIMMGYKIIFIVYLIGSQSMADTSYEWHKYSAESELPICNLLPIICLLIYK